MFPRCNFDNAGNISATSVINCVYWTMSLRGEKHRFSLDLERNLTPSLTKVLPAKDHDDYIAMTAPPVTDFKRNYYQTHLKHIRLKGYNRIP